MRDLPGAKAMSMLLIAKKRQQLCCCSSCVPAVEDYQLLMSVPGFQVDTFCSGLACGLGNGPPGFNRFHVPEHEMVVTGGDLFANWYHGVWQDEVPGERFCCGSEGLSAPFTRDATIQGTIRCSIAFPNGVISPFQEPPPPYDNIIPGRAYWVYLIRYRPEFLGLPDWTLSAGCRFVASLYHIRPRLPSEATPPTGIFTAYRNYGPGFVPGQTVDCECSNDHILDPNGTTTAEPVTLEVS